MGLLWDSNEDKIANAKKKNAEARKMNAEANLKRAGAKFQAESDKAKAEIERQKAMAAQAEAKAAEAKAEGAAKAVELAKINAAKEVDLAKVIEEKNQRLQELSGTAQYFEVALREVNVIKNDKERLSSICDVINSYVIPTDKEELIKLFPMLENEISRSVSFESFDTKTRNLFKIHLDAVQEKLKVWDVQCDTLYSDDEEIKKLKEKLVSYVYPQIEERIVRIIELKEEEESRLQEENERLKIEEERRRQEEKERLKAEEERRCQEEKERQKREEENRIEVEKERLKREFELKKANSFAGQMERLQTLFEREKPTEEEKKEQKTLFIGLAILSLIVGVIAFTANYFSAESSINRALSNNDLESAYVSLKEMDNGYKKDQMIVVFSNAVRMECEDAVVMKDNDKLMSCMKKYYRFIIKAPQVYNYIIENGMADEVEPLIDIDRSVKLDGFDLRDPKGGELFYLCRATYMCKNGDVKGAKAYIDKKVKEIHNGSKEIKDSYYSYLKEYFNKKGK